VQPGHEWDWIDILKRTGLFTDVDRDGYACALSVDVRIPEPPAPVQLASPAANLSTQGHPPLERIVQQITAQLPASAQINVLQKHESLLKFEIRNIRGVILSNKNFWERLEVYLVRTPDLAANRSEITAIVDGYFASGIGDIPPTISSYESMEKSYYADLVTFVQIFFNKLRLN